MTQAVRMGGPIRRIIFCMVNLLGVLSFILAIVAIVQTYRADKFARKIAKNEGVFEKPGISLSLFNYQMIEE